MIQAITQPALATQYSVSPHYLSLHHSSDRDVSAKPAYLSSFMLDRLAFLSSQAQWILLTAECPRPSYQHLMAYNIDCHNILQIRSSKYLSETDVVIKAIKSGNASAVIASNQISPLDQRLLYTIAQQHHCELFFMDNHTHEQYTRRLIS